MSAILCTKGGACPFLSVRLFFAVAVSLLPLCLPPLWIFLFCESPGQARAIFKCDFKNKASRDIFFCSFPVSLPFLLFVARGKLRTVRRRHFKFYKLQLLRSRIPIQLFKPVEKNSRLCEMANQLDESLTTGWILALKFTKHGFKKKSKSKSYTTICINKV